MPDVDMSDVDMPGVDMPDVDHPSRAAAARPRPQSPASPRPTKRRRRPHAPLRLLDLPFDALKSIVRHLHAAPRRPLTSLGPADRAPALLRASHLAPLLHVRLAHPLLRDAFDAHVAALDLSDLCARQLAVFVTRHLPLLRNLTTLAVPAALQQEGSLPLWRAALAAPAAPALRHLVFLPACDVSPAVATLLASALAASLECVATAAPAVLSALAVRAPRAPSRVAAAELLMDGLDDALLARLGALRELRLLYRRGLSRERGAVLGDALARLPQLASVHVRANGACSSDFDVFARLPRLTRLALFDGRVVGTPGAAARRGDGGGGARGRGRGLQHLVACRFLTDVLLEWMDGLSGGDVAVLAAGLGDRLRALRIWNCYSVTDEGLVAVARHCPRAEVELEFTREQFSNAALAALGDRVSWASTVF